MQIQCLIRELSNINRIYLLIFIIISFIYSSHRCGFIDQINSEDQTRTRPQTETYISSPSGHFYIHYDLSGQHAPNLLDENFNNIPDYIDEVGIIADSTRHVLLNIMGFNSEPNDNDQIYDIYIQDMGPYYYGLTVFDDQEGEEVGASYMKIDNEYEEGDYFIPGINTMRLTVAHEFFHAIQRGYRAYPTSSTLFFYEMSSTWIEDVIVPDGDDYLNWTGNFFNDPEKDIDDTDGYSIALYGHYLTQVIESSSNQMESTIIKEMWERFSIYNNAYNAIEYILQNQYSYDFIETWVDFCARNLFNGDFIDMNNNIYFYEDQINANSVIYEIDDIPPNNIFEDIIVGNKKVRFKSIDLSDNYFLTLSGMTNEILGNVALYSNTSYVASLYNDDYIYVGEDDILHILLGGYSNQIIDLELYTYKWGDVNQDNMINVIDIVNIVEVVVSEEYEYNGLMDLNQDTIINVIDIIIAVNIILDS